jgi:cytochrome c-type biogenesis protein CcmH/NrfG
MVILNDQGDSERLIVLARKAADFNDRSSAAQLFVFQNSLSSDAEKSEALKKLIALDPNNLYFNQFLIK